MSWFDETDIGKSFKVNWISGEVSEGKLIQVGDIYCIEFEDGEKKRFENNDIESIAEIKVSKPAKSYKNIRIIKKSSKNEKKPKIYEKKADLFLYLQQNLKTNSSLGIETIKFNKALILAHINNFRNLVNNLSLENDQYMEIEKHIDISLNRSPEIYKPEKLKKVSELFFYIQRNIKTNFDETMIMIRLNKDLLEDKEVEFFNLIKTSNISEEKIKFMDREGVINIKKIKEIENYINPKIKKATKYLLEHKWGLALDIFNELYSKEKLPVSKLLLYVQALDKAETLDKEDGYDKLTTILEKQISKQYNMGTKIKHIKQLSFYYAKNNSVDDALILLENALKDFKDIKDEEKVALITQAILIKTRNNNFDDLEKDLLKLEKIDPYNPMRDKVKSFTNKTHSNEEIDELIEQNIDYSTEFNNLNKFIQFYLDSCEFKGVTATKAKSKKFTKSDYSESYNLDSIISPKEKAERLLTAVIIGKSLGVEDEEINTKLIESLRFQANYYTSQNRYDIAKNYYLTILNLFEFSNKEDWYLNDILNEYLKTSLKTNRNISLPDTLVKIVSKDATENLIINLRLFSKKAFDRLFHKLQTNISILDIYESTYKISQMIESDDLYQKIESDLQIISKKVIEDDSIIQMLNSIDRAFLFELDERYFEDFKKVFEEFQNIYTANSYEEKELILERCKNQFEKLKDAIKASPAIFSINNLLDLIGVFLLKLDEYTNKLKKLSLPKLKISTPIDSYTNKNGRFDFYLTIKNDENCSPAKNLTIQVIEGNSIVAEKTIVKVSGGKSETIEILLDAPDKDTFSIAVKIIYENVSEEENILEKDFAISFEDEKEFEIIDNPYFPDSDGVKDRNMVYGRDKLINNISDMLYEQNVKGVVLYGQKRSGKSTIFHWLQEEMNERGDKFFTIYFSMGEVESFDGFIRNIVKRIKRDYKKRYKINIFEHIEEEEKEIEDLTDLFDFLESVKEFIEKQNLQLLILIDEFTYLYGFIKSGRYPESFLKNWKALIQRDLFKSALIGQNSMPLFINEYPNEMAVYKKEKLSYLDKKSAYRLIDEPIRLKDGRTRYKDDAIDLIYQYTNGSPYYIQKVCDKLVWYLNDKKSTYITIAHIKNVIELLFENMTLEGDFDNLITIGDGADPKIERLRKEAIIMIALKSKHIGSASFEEISLHCTDEDKQSIIKALIDTDVINVSQNGRYSIVVKLLEKYLQQSHQQWGHL